MRALPLAINEVGRIFKDTLPLAVNARTFAAIINKNQERIKSFENRVSYSRSFHVLEFAQVFCAARHLGRSKLYVPSTRGEERLGATGTKNVGRPVRRYSHWSTKLYLCFVRVLPHGGAFYAAARFFGESVAISAFGKEVHHLGVSWRGSVGLALRGPDHSSS